ncbi:MAG: flagellar motor protein MotA [Gammaproteobacteria bacterium]|nr:MAG: flagellar motor protein MotA [Gammaproteobacteria bacterium]
MLFWMAVFLVAVGLLALTAVQPLSNAFMANPTFNGIIFGVLVVGILINFRQVLILEPERKWIEQFRRSDPERPISVKPRLLAPMAQMLSRRERGELTLSPLSMRTVLDSIRMRLDESRDISRYMTGVLIFLGLLGTFWGLLITVGAVGSVIDGLQIGAGEGPAVFESLKAGLREPLSGMGTAFSSSLFGLAGALVLGFLDLQATHAQNRFFNELEEWLSGATRLSSGALPGDGEVGVPAYIQALLEHTADNIEQFQKGLVRDQEQRKLGDQRLVAVADQLGKLTDQFRSEAMDRDKLIREFHSELRLLNKSLAKK